MHVYLVLSSSALSFVGGHLIREARCLTFTSLAALQALTTLATAPPGPGLPEGWRLSARAWRPVADLRSV